MNGFDTHPFFVAFNGSFKGILRWPQLDELWRCVSSNGENWYIYAVGEEPPETTASAAELKSFIEEVDILLRQDHDEDYCGIVYTDDREQPTFIKIFDPHNLGVSCGASSVKPLPGWILTKMKPINLPDAFPHTGNRKRWWQKIFNSK